MICIPAELHVQDKSIIAQMEKVKEAQRVCRDEMFELEKLLVNTKVMEKCGGEGIGNNREELQSS